MKQDTSAARNLFISKLFLGIGPGRLQPGHPVNHIHRDAEPIDLVAYGPVPAAC